MTTVLPFCCCKSFIITIVFTEKWNNLVAWFWALAPHSAPADLWGEVKGKNKNIGCVPCDIPGTTEPSSLWWDMLLLGEPDWSLIEQPHVSRVSANSRFRWSITLSVTLHSPLFSNKFCTIIRAEEKLTLPPKLQWSIVSLKCNKIWAYTTSSLCAITWW